MVVSKFYDHWLGLFVTHWANTDTKSSKWNSYGKWKQGQNSQNKISQWFKKKNLSGTVLENLSSVWKAIGNNIGITSVPPLPPPPLTKIDLKQVCNGNCLYCPLWFSNKKKSELYPSQFTLRASSKLICHIAKLSQAQAPRVALVSVVSRPAGHTSRKV